MKKIPIKKVQNGMVALSKLFFRVKVTKTGIQNQIKLPGSISEYTKPIKGEFFYNPTLNEIYFKIIKNQPMDESIFLHLEEWFREQIQEN